MVPRSVIDRRCSRVLFFFFTHVTVHPRLGSFRSQLLRTAIEHNSPHLVATKLPRVSFNVHPRDLDANVRRVHTSCTRRAGWVSRTEIISVNVAESPTSTPSTTWVSRSRISRRYGRISRSYRENREPEPFDSHHGESSVRRGKKQDTEDKTLVDTYRRVTSQWL